jgi:hypothetical protein
MNRLMQSLAITAGLLIPATLSSASALADGPSASAATVNTSAIIAAISDTSTLTLSNGSTGFSAITRASETSRVANLLNPDLQIRIVDRDPVNLPSVILGQTEDIAVQVRNASGLEAGNVAFELYVTGHLDAQNVLSATNGFTCSLNSPQDHFVLCTGGTLTPGDWSSAATVSIRVVGAHSGSSVVVATVNPGHPLAETDFDNDQSSRWITVSAS